MGPQALIYHASGQKTFEIANVVSVFIKPAKKSITLRMKCKFCKNIFIVFNKGRRNCHSIHQDKSMKVANAVSILINTVKKAKILTLRTSKDLPYTKVFSGAQSTITKYIANSETEKAEMRWVLKRTTTALATSHV